MTAGNVGHRMSKTLNEIVAAADWKELTPHLLYYADNLIRQCPWRGLAVSAGRASKLCVEAFGADDLLQEALERFLSGRRTYNHLVSLDQNLKGAIRSIVWSLNKSSRRAPLIEVTQTEDEADAMEQFPSLAPTADAAATENERAREQERMLEAFEESLTDEHDLLHLVVAYKAGHSKPRDVERITGIPAARVSELKRKLRSRMQQFKAPGTQHKDT